MALTIIENACVFDGFHDELSEGQNLVIENDIIREISSEPVKSQSGTRIDVKGGTVMPGLIGDALFVLDRTTWIGEQFITTIKLYYRSGYQLYSSL